MGSEGLHEDPRDLSREVKDRHRAIRSLMEELEAVDWYDQRVEACGDPELRDILAHNRDEEKEHAAMMIEWLRRHDPTFERMLKTYLFTSESILEVEEADTGGAAAKAEEGGRPDGGTKPSVGSLRNP